MATRRPTSQRKRLNVQRRLLRTTGRVPGRGRTEEGPTEGAVPAAESRVDLVEEPPDLELLLSPG